MSSDPAAIEDQLRAATEAFRRSDAAQGLTLIHAVTEACGDRKDVYLRAAKTLLTARQAIEALLLLEQALTKFPSSGVLLDCFRQASEYAKGSVKVRKALSQIVTRLTGDDVLSRVGRVLLGQGQLEIALTALQRAQAINAERPDNLAALGLCLFQMNHKAEAIEALAQALKLDPDNPDIRHMYDSFSGADVSAAPLAYIERLFDAYAEKFDADLLGRLEYRTPQDVLTILKTLRPETGAFSSFLDVGCGTGLIAGALKTHYRIAHAVGVDLSRNMLDVAAPKNLYEELLCGDAIKILYDLGTMFDLIAAIEVPIYLGDLWGLTAAVADRLAPGGLYVYSIETMPTGTYKLLPSQRFAHTVRYVENIAASFGLIPLSGMETVIRLDAGKPLPGYVGVLIKATES